MNLQLPRRPRIAVFRALQLGDMLTAVPAMRSLRAGFPGAEITLIGLPWASELACRLPYVDRFVVFEGYPGIAERPFCSEASARFFAEQRAYGYDLVVQMHGSGGVSNPLCLELGGAATAGYYEGSVPEDLALAAPYPHHLSEIERQTALVALLGGPDRGLGLEFPLWDHERTAASSLLDGVEPGPCIGFHVGANAPSRRWPTDRFAATALTLMRHWDAHIVVTGSGADRALTQPFVEALLTSGENTTRVHDLSGRTSLGVLAAVLAKLDLLVSNDTGPAHLAEAMGTPSVRLFGPVDPARWAPLDRQQHRVVRHEVACSPCGHAVCPIDHRCLLRIQPREVIAAANGLLGDRLSVHATKESYSWGA